MAPLPQLTHLQFLILEALWDGDIAGSDLRAALRDNGAPRTLPAFYEVMARLEKAGYAQGSYRTESLRGQVVRVRDYAITDAGRAAYRATWRFYADRRAPNPQESS